MEPSEDPEDEPSLAEEDEDVNASNRPPVTRENEVGMSRSMVDRLYCMTACDVSVKWCTSLPCM